MISAQHGQGAGPSAKGAMIHPESLDEDVRRAVENPSDTIRLDRSVDPTSPLPPETIARLGLPEEPPWMTFFDAGRPHPWRSDPALSERFHPDYPDDLRVEFFFGAAAETMWVRTTGVNREVNGYEGELMNQPYSNESRLASGDLVIYRAVRGMLNPIWVDPDARAHLGRWTSECTECGFDLLFESAEAIAGRQFDIQDGMKMDMFTTRCRRCGGRMLVRRRS